MYIFLFRLAVGVGRWHVAGEPVGHRAVGRHRGAEWDGAWAHPVGRRARPLVEWPEARGQVYKVCHCFNNFSVENDNQSYWISLLKKTTSCIIMTCFLSHTLSFFILVFNVALKVLILE